MERPNSPPDGDDAVRIWPSILRAAVFLGVAWAAPAGMSPLSFNGISILVVALVASLLGAYELGIRDVAGKWIMAWMIGVSALGDVGYGAWWLLRPAPITGPLTPADDPSPSMSCREKPGPGELGIAFGTNRVIAKGAGPFTPFTMGNCSGPTLKRVPGGLMVDGFYYDLTGSITMAVRDNKFEPYQPVAFRFFRPDPHTLLILDHFDTEVLYVRWLNPRWVRVRGRWLCGDQPRAVVSDRHVMMDGIRILGDYFGQQAAPGHVCARLTPGADGIAIAQ